VLTGWLREKSRKFAIFEVEVGEWIDQKTRPKFFKRSPTAPFVVVVLLLLLLLLMLLMLLLPVMRV